MTAHLVLIYICSVCLAVLGIRELQRQLSPVGTHQPWDWVCLLAVLLPVINTMVAVWLVADRCVKIMNSLRK